MLRLASWNLRYDSMPDSISVEESLRSLPRPGHSPTFRNVSGEQPWSARRIQVARTILHEDVHIVGFQEALARQVEDLLDLLGESSWSYVGVGREDGEKQGEFSPIFYKHSEFSLLSTDTFWLSHTPFKPSKFPGAGSTRICTAAKFSSKQESGSPIVFLNTHLDNDSDDQRKLGSSMILARARFEAAASGGLVFLSGDLNSSSTGKDDSAYKIITGVSSPVSVSEEFLRRYRVPDNRLPSFCMLDILTRTSPLSISGNFATYTSFKNPENASAETGRIDFIFGGNNGGWISEGYTVPSALIDDGTLASDHRPVFVRISQKLN